MADQEVGSLKVKVGIDGTGFQDGISTINRQLKIVQSEFQATSAQLKDFGSSTDLLNAKSASLSKQIDLQRQRVEALQNAVAKSAAEKGEDARQTDLLTIKLNKAQAQLASTESELRNTQQQLRETGLALKGVGDEAGRSTGMFATLGQTLKSAVLFSGVYGGLYGITSAFKNAISAGIQFDSSMQQAQIGFTTMLGSASAARDMLNQIADFAKSTPFTIAGVEESAKQMLAMGFAAKDVLPDMRAIGDAAAALGLQTDGIQRLTLALGQMRTHGTADAQDMLQLTEAGIPAWQMLAQSMGKTIPQLQSMVSKGLVPAKQATDALIADMEARYPNMLQKMNASFTSEMGNLSDSMNITFGTVLKPTFDWLTNTALPKLQSGIDKFQNTLTQTGSLSAAFKTILPPALVDGVTALANAVKDTFNFIQQNGPAIKATLIGVGAAIAAMKLSSMFTGAVTGVTLFITEINKLRAAEETLGVVQTLLNRSMAATGITELIAAFRTLRTVETELTVVQAALNVIMDANPIGAIAAAIGVLIALGTALVIAWKNDWGGIQEKTKAVVGVIKAYFMGLVDAIKVDFYAMNTAVLEIINTIMKIVAPLIKLIGTIAPGFEEGFKRVQTAIDNTTQQSLKNFQNSLQATTADAEQLVQAGRDVANSFGAASRAIAATDDTMTQAQARHAAYMQSLAPKSAPTRVNVSSGTSATDAALRAAIMPSASTKTTATKTAQDIVQAFIDGINSKMAPLNRTVDQLKASLQFHTDKGDTKVVTDTIKSLISDYQQELKQLGSTMDSVNAEIKKFNPKTQAADIAKLKDEYSQLAVEWYNDQDAIVQLNDKMKQTAIDAAKSAADAFKSMTDSEMNSVNTALQAELSAIQREHQAALQAFDDETQRMVDSIDAQIAALQQLQTQDDRSKQQEQWTSQMGDLKHQLDVANLMNDPRTVKQVQSQIDQLNQQISDQQKQWNRQDQEQALQQQKQALQTQRAQQRAALDQEYADREAAFQQQMEQEMKQFQALQTALLQAIQDQKLTKDQANAAWVQSIKDTGDKSLQAEIDGQQKSQTELTKWVQSYLDVGKSYGTSLGKGLVAGLNSMLGAVRAAAEQLASAASSAIGAGGSALASATASIKVPALAQGGIFNGPALIGEAGPEAAIPLNDSTMSRLASAITAKMPGGGSGGQPINIYLDGQLIGSYVWDMGLEQVQARQRKG